MKRIHLAILITGLVLMALSGYSIAVINLVYNVPFEWYSKLNNNFKNEQRNTSFYENLYDNKNMKPKFEVITGNNSEGGGIKRIRSILNPDFNKYIYIYCTRGEVTQNDANIKIKEMAQRGNTVEVIVAINATTDKSGDNILYPEDIVRIDKKLLLNKGKLVYVFKNQFGVRLAESTADILEK